jgi:hypothetical protein
MPATESALSPSKHSPPALMHLSQLRCHFWKESWYAFFRVARSSVCDLSVISWIVWNHPFKMDFSLGNKKKSAGARLGEQDGWGSTVVFVLAEKSRISIDAWTGALSWWRNQELFHHNWGLFLWYFLLDVSSLRDITSDSLFDPDVRIHDAQHPRCKKKRSTRLSRSTWPAVPFRSRRIFSNPLWRLNFRFHVVSINPCFIAGYNSFQKVFFLVSASQKFLTYGNATVSLILCRKSWDKLWNYPIHFYFCRKNVMTWSNRYVSLFCYFPHCRTTIRMRDFTNLGNMSVVTWRWGPSQTRLIVCWPPSALKSIKPFITTCTAHALIIINIFHRFRSLRKGFP